MAYSPASVTARFPKSAWRPADGRSPAAAQRVARRLLLSAIHDYLHLPEDNEESFLAKMWLLDEASSEADHLSIGWVCHTLNIDRQAFFASARARFTPAIKAVTEPQDGMEFMPKELDDEPLVIIKKEIANGR